MSTPGMGQERPHDSGDIGSRFSRIERWRSRREARDKGTQVGDLRHEWEMTQFG